MRKHSHRRQRQSAPPVLIALAIKQQHETAERMAVSLIRAGAALPAHFNDLVECNQMLHFAAEKLRNQEVKGIARFTQLAIDNISSRYRTTKRIGATGEELKALETMVDYALDFWKRQAGSLFADCYREVAELRNQHQKKAA